MTYGPLRPDLTPGDLLAAGYTLRAHANGGWCWWTVRPCGGQSFGESCARIEDAVASARWQMTGQRQRATQWQQLSLLTEGV